MIHYSITPADMEDLPDIWRLFEVAIRFQQQHNYIGWASLDKAYIQKDIEKQLLFKVTCPNQLAGIFCVCYSDELIWGEREKGNAIYLHRIVVNREIKGFQLFEKVLKWALNTALQKRLQYIRMDTWADNTKLIAYYESYGFKALETFTTANTENLPEQHRNLKVVLLEMKIKQES